MSNCQFYTIGYPAHVTTYLTIKLLKHIKDLGRIAITKLPPLPLSISKNQPPNLFATFKTTRFVLPLLPSFH